MLLLSRLNSLIKVGRVTLLRHGRAPTSVGTVPAIASHLDVAIRVKDRLTELKIALRPAA